jgi:hypothetical protein
MKAVRYYGKEDIRVEQVAAPSGPGPKHIKGTIGSPGVWPAALRFLARTKLDLSPIQTHFFDLTKGAEAFEFGKNPKECIKVTLTNAA